MKPVKPIKQNFDIIQSELRHKRGELLKVLKLMRLWKLKLSDARRLFLMKPGLSFSKLAKNNERLTNGQVYVLSLIAKLKSVLNESMRVEQQAHLLHKKQTLMLGDSYFLPSHQNTSYFEFILPKNTKNEIDYTIISRLTKVYYKLR